MFPTCVKNGASLRTTSSYRDDYLDLVKRLPLRVIRNERKLDAATNVAMQLAIKGEHQLSDGETAYLDALDRLIEDYEQTFHPMPLRDAGPLERLRLLIKEVGMSASDVGRLLNNRSLGSLLLSGRRELSKNHIRVLAQHFRLEAGYFL